MRLSRPVVPFLLTIALAACGQTAAPSASPAAASPSTAPASIAASAKPAASAPAASAKPAASGSAAVKPAASAAAAASGQALPSGSGSGTSFSGGDPNGTVVKIAYASPSVASWPFYAALDAGMFAQQHLNVQMITMAANVAVTALSKGEIDHTNSPSNAMEGATRGLPMKMTLSSWARTPWTIVGKADIKSLADLKGKVLGTNLAGSSPYLYMQAAFKRDNVDISAVKIASSPGTQQTYELLLAGQVDAAVVSPPFDADAATRGFHEIEFIGDALDFPYIGLGTATAYISSHRPTLVATIKALMDANAWLKSHPSDAENLVVKYIGVTPEVAKLTTEKELPLLSDNGELPNDGLVQTIQVQEDITKTKIDMNPSDLVDWGPLHEALGKS
ncbi:MAG: ABC transporter substrate-binding protein [Chloroflexi bacterium]|nr:ABC transporter substrate-binding protein [Chloroflexota bacterium]